MRNPNDDYRPNEGVQSGVPTDLAVTEAFTAAIYGGEFAGAPYTHRGIAAILEAGKPTLAATDDSLHDTPLRRAMLDSADRLAKGLPASGVVYPGHYPWVVVNVKTFRIYALCETCAAAQEICENNLGMAWESMTFSGLMTRANYDRAMRAITLEDEPK